jgi:hypothetical protein
MKALTYFQENSNDYLTNRNDLLFVSSQYCKLEDRYVIKYDPFCMCAVSLIYKNSVPPYRLFTFVLIFHIKNHHIKFKEYTTRRRNCWAERGYLQQEAYKNSKRKFNKF